MAARRRDSAPCSPEERLEKVARLHGGELDPLTVPLLLRALWQDGRTCTLRVERGRVLKTIAFESGHPVGCESNLAHERLGRFLVDLGELGDAEFAACLSAAVSRSVSLGEVLVERRLMAPHQLFRRLRQLLAKQLLDVFTWPDGRFSLSGDPLELPAPLPVRTPQLVFTGCYSFTPERVVAAVLAAAGPSFVRHPDPEVPLAELHLNLPQRKILDRLERPAELEGLATETGVAHSEVARVVFALLVLGTVIEESRWRTLAPADGARQRPVESDELRDAELARLFLSYRRSDAFDLLGVPEGAPASEIDRRYLDFARRVAPWARTDPEMRDQAEALFLTAAKAYGELRDPARREALLKSRRRGRRAREGGRRMQRIETSVLDPLAQFREGRRLLLAGEPQKALVHLEIAADGDPLNPLFRAEAAYCRFQVHPERAESALKSLWETIRIDPECGTAYLHAGEVALALERFAEAESLLRQASRLMAPDRRPLDRLQELGHARRRRQARPARA